MRKVSCHECGKSYNYDVDDFCPKCGAYTQPLRTTCIGADGAVVRVDGLNESGHTGSFVHSELHEETKERRRNGLDRNVSSVPRPVLPRQSAGSSSFRREQTRKGPFAIIVWIIFAVIALNVLSTFLSIVF